VRAAARVRVHRCPVYNWAEVLILGIHRRCAPRPKGNGGLSTAVPQPLVGDRLQGLPPGSLGHHMPKLLPSPGSARGNGPAWERLRGNQPVVVHTARAYASPRLGWAAAPCRLVPAGLPLHASHRRQPSSPPRPECAALVALHQAGVADNVCSEDRRQFALLTGQWNFPALLQRTVEGLRPLGNQGKQGGRGATVQPNRSAFGSNTIAWMGSNPASAQPSIF